MGPSVTNNYESRITNYRKARRKRHIIASGFHLGQILLKFAASRTDLSTRQPNRNRQYQLANPLTISIDLIEKFSLWPDVVTSLTHPTSCKSINSLLSEHAHDDTQTTLPSAAGIWPRDRTARRLDRDHGLTELLRHDQRTREPFAYSVQAERRRQRTSGRHRRRQQA